MRVTAVSGEPLQQFAGGGLGNVFKRARFHGSFFHNAHGGALRAGGGQYGIDGRLRFNVGFQIQIIRGAFGDGMENRRRHQAAIMAVPAVRP